MRKRRHKPEGSWIKNAEAVVDLRCSSSATPDQQQADCAGGQQDQRARLRRDGRRRIFQGHAAPIVQELVGLHVEPARVARQRREGVIVGVPVSMVQVVGPDASAEPEGIPKVAIPGRANEFLLRLL